MLFIIAKKGPHKHATIQTLLMILQCNIRFKVILYMYELQ